MKKLKKGFTLVELLVVIAILAVLATAAIVGYSAFTKKANNSNALTEIKQSIDSIMSDVISATGGTDQAVVCSGVEFKYKKELGKVVFDYEFDGLPEGSMIGITNSIKRQFTDLNNIEGYFIYEKSNPSKIYHITTNKKGIAMWESGKDPRAIDIDIDKDLKNIDLGDETEPDTPEEKEGYVTIYFGLCDGSPSLGNVPNYIQVEKGSNVILSLNYIQYGRNTKTIASGNVSAQYYNSRTVDATNGMFEIQNVQEDKNIYINFVTKHIAE